MSKFAEKTQVSVDRSKAEIERTLSRYGADQFLHGWDNEKAMIGFRLGGKMVRFIITLPDRNDSEFTTTETGRERSEPQVYKAWEQSCRQRWRALSLVIKAKLEAVESEITTFEEEFLAHIQLPDGTTVGEQAIPALCAAYETGDMPLLLPSLGGTK